MFILLLNVELTDFVIVTFTYEKMTGFGNLITVDRFYIQDCFVFEPSHKLVLQFWF